MPFVPWPHDTTGKPSAGGEPFGTAINPVTGVGLSRTVVDTYMTRYTVPWILGSVRRSDLMSAPGFVGIGSVNA